MKKDKGDIFIIIVLALLIALLVGLVIYWGKSVKNTEDLIVEAISEDQDATGDKVVAYKIEKLNSDEYVLYTATIINDKGEVIDYIIRFDNKEIVYCEERK